MRLIYKVVFITVVATSVTNCHWTMSTPSGLREHHRGMNGLITTGKATPDIDDAYHKTQRDTDPTSLEKLKMQLEAMKDGG